MRILKAENSVAAKKLMLAEMPKRVPAGWNYHDLMMQAEDAYWNNYEFFFLSDSRGYVLGGLSPEESLNVYGTETLLISEMTNHVLSNLGKRPVFFRGNAEAMGDLSRHEWLKNPLYVRTVSCLKARIAGFGNPTGDFEFVRASKEHLSQVVSWLAAFNAESEATWDLPTETSLVNKPHWLLRDRSGEFLGGVVQTMTVADRLWVGRMYVPPAFRQQGIGRHLLERVAWAARGTAAEIHLHVHEDNGAGVQFYRRLGFGEIGRFFYARIRAS